MKLLFISLCAFVSVSVNAQSEKQSQLNQQCRKNDPGFDVIVKPEQGGSFVLQLDNPEMKKISIQISHAELGTAVDTVVQSATYYCRYRFDLAEDGNYTIRVGNGKQVVSRKLQIETRAFVTRQIEIR
ncbi:hypothetical protein [Flavihumibacter petaseus]|uniref:Secretion system C-terminal sorting domain-containing protein n=1 Tax=Flavihumibacter petaseus NBRC 106054 TaxID=1220578 RepID=A0A0E9N0L1_9BACT|nr:hypothetical protein [Flavihumibacter petaseus]GAO43323.1 hypothetical protein FPE01S_02_04280 [Flavihumibacter petaseus NBRC 106054]